MASPGTSGWRGPIEITWRDSVDIPSIPIDCKCMGGWFVLKSIAHGSKCPIELCLPSMLVGNLVNWWKLASNSRFICRMQQTKSFKLYLFTGKHWAWDLSGQSTSNSPIIYQHSRHEIFVIFLEVTVNLFITTWFWTPKFTSPWQIFRKSPS